MAQLFITFALLFGSGIIGYFYAWSSWQDFSKLREASQNATSVSSELDELDKNRNDLLATINSVSKEDNTRIDESLPTSPRTGELLVFLENLSLKHGVTLRRVDLTVPPEEKPVETKSSQPRPTGNVVKSIGGVKIFPITLELVATYDTFKTLLDDLERSLRIIDIQSVTFSAPSTLSDKMNFSLKGKTYYQ